ncbi:MAG: hypothetical protein AB7F65_02340 [Dehalococcoidia bacterium]
MNILRTGILGVATALLGGVLAAGTANAQIYPQPDGYCVISLSDPLPPTEAQVTLTVTAADRAGQPLSGISGELEIVQQPGDSAYLEPSAYTTGADGTAEVVLHTGAEAGLIRVASECDEISVTANVNVGQPPGPPATGSGPSGLGDGTPALATLAGVLGAVGAVGVVGIAGRGVARLRRRVER